MWWTIKYSVEVLSYDDWRCEQLWTNLLNQVTKNRNCFPPPYFNNILYNISRPTYLCMNILLYCINYNSKYNNRNKKKKFYSALLNTDYILPIFRYQLGLLEKSSRRMCGTKCLKKMIPTLICSIVFLYSHQLREYQM